MSREVNEKKKKTGGRPTIEEGLQRIKRVTVPLTQSEYEWLVKLAGAEAQSKNPSESSTGKMRKSRRKQGSFTGYLRNILLTARQPITPEQLALLNKLVDRFNTLDELSEKAESIGLLAMKNSFTALQQRLNMLLDDVDQTFKRQK